MERDSTKRFSDRVEHYIRYRPRYPRLLAEYLEREFEPIAQLGVADIGSGTGFLSELFLQRGHRVYGVEPNREMRLAAEKALASYDGFQSIDGTGEATTLPSGSVDLITVGQAFHWLDAEQAGKEFRRIARPAGIAAIIWNNRKIEGDPFSMAYEELVRTFSADHDYVANRGRAAMSNGAMDRLFGEGNYRQALFDNSQRFDFEGLRGRLLSSSYAPLEGNPAHEPMMVGLRRIFDEHQQNGEVMFTYDTQLFYGRLAERA